MLLIKDGLGKYVVPAHLNNALYRFNQDQYFVFAYSCYKFMVQIIY